MNILNTFIDAGSDEKLLKSLVGDNVHVDQEELIKAMNKAGLVQKEVQVRGKNGQVFTRKQWVKASEDVAQPKQAPAKESTEEVRKRQDTASAEYKRVLNSHMVKLQKEGSLKLTSSTGKTFEFRANKTSKFKEPRFTLLVDGKQVSDTLNAEKVRAKISMNMTLDNLKGSTSDNNTKESKGTTKNSKHTDLSSLSEDKFKAILDSALKRSDIPDGTVVSGGGYKYEKTKGTNVYQWKNTSTGKMFGSMQVASILTGFSDAKISADMNEEIEPAKDAQASSTKPRKVSNVDDIVNGIKKVNRTIAKDLNIHNGVSAPGGHNLSNSSSYGYSAYVSIAKFGGDEGKAKETVENYLKKEFGDSVQLETHKDDSHSGALIIDVKIPQPKSTKPISNEQPKSDKTGGSAYENGSVDKDGNLVADDKSSLSDLVEEITDKDMFDIKDLADEVLSKEIQDGAHYNGHFIETFEYESAKLVGDKVEVNARVYGSIDLDDGSKDAFDKTVSFSIPLSSDSQGGFKASDSSNTPKKYSASEKSNNYDTLARKYLRLTGFGIDNPMSEIQKVHAEVEKMYKDGGLTKKDYDALTKKGAEAEKSSKFNSSQKVKKKDTVGTTSHDSSNQQPTGGQKLSPADAKKRTQSFTSKVGKTDKERSDFMSKAKAQGITWKENDNAGINWMRCCMAMNKHFENGGDWNEGSKSSSEPTQSNPKKVTGKSGKPYSIWKDGSSIKGSIPGKEDSRNARDIKNFTSSGFNTLDEVEEYVKKYF